MSAPGGSVALTAQRLIERSMRVHRHALAVVDGPRRISYAALCDRTARLANVLVDLGAGADRPVALYMSNRAEYIEADVAATRAGVTRVGVGDRLHADEARFILGHCSAGVLVTTSALLERLGDARDLDLDAIIVMPDGHPVAGFGARGPRTLDYEEALADASDRLALSAVSPDHPSYVIYTSGTTGRPKGAAHSHGARVASMLNMTSSELWLDRSSVMVHAGPLTHGSGSKTIAVLAAGGTNLVLRRFDIDSLVAAIEHERGSHTFLVPTMIQRLLDSGNGVRERIRSLTQISFGGSPISPLTFGRAIDEFGPILTQVYGSCEAPHPVTVLRPADYLHGSALDDGVLASAGTASWGIDIAVGEPPVPGSVEPGAEGELFVRGSHVMAGYWNDPEATSSVMTEDGWYRTGDLVRIDDEHRVVFQDRKRDLIISGGLNVYPSEVERVIAEHELVQNVAVVGYPDPEWGESVLAYIVPTTAGALTEDDVKQWTGERLAGYKKPRRVVFLAELPLGSSNKVLKSRLRDPHWDGMSRRVN